MMVVNTSPLSLLRVSTATNEQRLTSYGVLPRPILFFFHARTVMAHGSWLMHLTAITLREWDVRSPASDAQSPASTDPFPITQ
jgi:hypothetical protein